MSELALRLIAENRDVAFLSVVRALRQSIEAIKAKNSVIIKNN